jgi:hypothetical protein
LLQTPYDSLRHALMCSCSVPALNVHMHQVWSCSGRIPASSVLKQRELSCSAYAHTTGRFLLPPLYSHNIGVLKHVRGVPLIVQCPCFWRAPALAVPLLMQCPCSCRAPAPWIVLALGVLLFLVYSHTGSASAWMSPSTWCSNPSCLRSICVPAPSVIKN